METFSITEAGISDTTKFGESATPVPLRAWRSLTDGGPRSERQVPK